MSPLVSYMARSGIGTDACYRRGSLPLPVHFYSPVPDLEDLNQRNVWARPSPLAGIDLGVDEQLSLLSELGSRYGAECIWPEQSTDDRHLYSTDNTNFSYGCASITHSLVRHFKPQRVIEIGSGNSSLVIAGALRANSREDPESRPEYHIIDPYPQERIRAGLSGLTQLHQERVELMDIAFFDQLGNRDILFIDSGHTVRIGGDVNFLLLDVVPRLGPGTLIHFHDIALPDEYSKAFLTNPRFRMLWTEAYLLQAFLSYNSEFQVLLAMNYLMTRYLEAYRSAFPHYDPDRHPYISGSFWIGRNWEIIEGKGVKQ